MDLLVLGILALLRSGKSKCNQELINQVKFSVRTLFIPRLEMNRLATNIFSTSYRGIWRCGGLLVCLSSIRRFSWFLLSLSSCLFLVPAPLSFSVPFLLLPGLFSLPAVPRFHFLFLTLLLLILLLASFLLAWPFWDTLNLFPAWHRKCSRAD